MADATTKKLLSLLDSEQSAETRGAAALVLGEIGARDGDVAGHLAALLDDVDPGVRLRALAAVGKLRIEQALPKVMEHVQAGGDEAEQAARTAARLGAKGTRALQNLMENTAPGLRRRIAGALATAETASAETAAIEALRDKDPGVVEAAARSLVAKVPSLTANHRRVLADHVLELFKKKQVNLTGTSEVALLRLLTALDDKRARIVFWERITPGRSLDVRIAALQGLGKWAATPDREQIKRLLACAGDSDFRVAGPALLVLKNLPAAKHPVAEWLRLLEAHDITVRCFAVEKLVERDSAEVATALVAQVQHPDQTLREKVLAGLAEMTHGRQALAELLLKADTPEQIWLLAKSISHLVKGFPFAWYQPLFARACVWLETGDRRSDGLLFLLREADAKGLTEKLAARGLAMRKKKNYTEAVSYLRLVARDPACDPELRMELAACGLKVSGKDLAAEARTADPALQQFTRLIGGYEAETLAFVKEAKWLEPDDLWYLGFNFADRVGPGQRFGGDVLRFLIQRSPRAKLAQDARRKLRAVGLD